MLKVFGAAAAAALFLAGMATPAMAQAQAPSAAQSGASETAVGDPNEKVCVKQEVTGSRLAVKRVCKTRAQWADQRLQERQEVERVQTQRGMKGD